MASDTESPPPKLEFIFISFITPGHIIPMVDMARLFASHGVAVIIITTTHNSLIFKNAIDRDIKSGKPIKLHVLPFPFADFGLPESLENMNYVMSPDQNPKLYQATMLPIKPIQQMLLDHIPNCIVPDMFCPWTVDFAVELGIPRIVFQGSSYFLLCAQYSMRHNVPYENVTSDMELFVVPGLQDQVELSRLQLPDHVRTKKVFSAMLDVIRKAELRSFGVLMNSFPELEPSYLYEIATALDTSNHPFIWVICNKEMIDGGDEAWLLNGLKSRVNERDSWRAIDCLAVKQFYNEKLVIQVVMTGVGVGTEKWLSLLEDDGKVVVKKKKIEKAIIRLMDGGDEVKEIRERAKELGRKAKRVVEVGGSSYNDLIGLIDENKKDWDRHFLSEQFKEDERIILTNTDGMDEMMKKFYKTKKEEILARNRDAHGSSTTRE
ncbi:hypothetical protein GIB67_016321 [Kingdonia uniflora]|uniref:Uncharacterized protein n=1 Tax=Kingdonia uniflora TaxID=39325 RepID=A0A7J7M9F1_9MAGN|nr:hypothetical protein GIB67_016321 [Kingdonia uniflora]